MLAAEPPSYDSLFGRIRDTHKASRNVIDFVVKVILLLLGTIGCTIACSITIVIPVLEEKKSFKEDNIFHTQVCMIVIGSVYFHDCPAEPYIPIFLIVGGSFSVFKVTRDLISKNLYKSIFRCGLKMACSIIDNIFVIGQIFDNILLLSWEVLVLLLLTIVGFGLTGREGGCRCNFLSML